MNKQRLDPAQMEAVAEALKFPEDAKAAEQRETRRMARLIEHGNTPVGFWLVSAAMFGGIAFFYSERWPFALLAALAGVVSAHAAWLIFKVVRLKRSVRGGDAA